MIGLTKKNEKSKKNGNPENPENPGNPENPENLSLELKNVQINTWNGNLHNIHRIGGFRYYIHMIMQKQYCILYGANKYVLQSKSLSYPIEANRRLDQGNNCKFSAQDFIKIRSLSAVTY